MANDSLLTYEQAAELLNLSPSTLRIYVMQKRIPYIKISKSVRFDRSSLNSFIDSKRVPARKEN